MEVILIQDVANLGYKNDIIKVKDGYGRNYLIPNRFAVIANDSNRKQLAENLKQQAHKMAKLLADAQALAEKLANTVITLSAKANEDGKIFGTITTAQVSEALAAQGIEIDGTTYPLIKLEISNTSHPFYTGKSKLVDTAGRVDKFMSHYGNRRK